MSSPINFDRYQWTNLTLSPVAVSANTSVEQTFTVPGLLGTDQVVHVAKATTQVGLAVGGERITSSGLLALNFTNVTSASITPTSGQVYSVLFCRPEKVLGGPDALSGNIIFP